MAKNTGNNNGSVWSGVGLVIASLAGLWMVDRGLTKRTSIKAEAWCRVTDSEAAAISDAAKSSVAVNFSEKRPYHPAVVVGGFTGRR